MIENYHPSDIWQNPKVLQVVQRYRHIKTFWCDGFSVLLHKMGPINLEAKVFLSREFTEKFVPLLMQTLREFNPIQIKLHCKSDCFIEESFKSIREEKRATLLIDLTLPNERLFQNIKGRKRSQIRKGLREGVTVTQKLNPEIFNKWWESYLITAKRGEFTPQKKEFVWDILQMPECRLFSAWRNGKMLAGNIIFANKFPFYWLGASFKEYAKLHAPSVLQWNIIETYQKEGFKIYDMGGASLDRLHGPTHFKKSIGSEYFEYKQLNVHSSIWLTSLLKTGAKLYYRYLKRPTW